MASRFIYRSSAHRALSADATEQRQRMGQGLSQTTTFQQTSGAGVAFGTTGEIHVQQGYQRIRPTSTTTIPIGRITQISSKSPESLSRGASERRRGLEREIEAARVIAQMGFKVEQNPGLINGKNPDYRIEDEVYDCYSPAKDTERHRIRETIKHKIRSGQTARVVLNLNDWRTDDETYNRDVGRLKASLIRTPIDGLEGVMIVRGDTVEQL